MQTLLREETITSPATASYQLSRLVKRYGLAEILDRLQTLCAEQYELTQEEMMGKTIGLLEKATETALHTQDFR